MARLCAVNFRLHGIRGDSETPVPILVKGALGAKHGEYEMVLTDPPSERGAASQSSTKLGARRNRRSSFTVTILGYDEQLDSSTSSSTFLRYPEYNHRNESDSCSDFEVIHGFCLIRNRGG